VVAGCSACMAAICPPDKPLPIMWSFTFLCHAVPSFVGLILAFVHASNTCQKPLHVWLIILFGIATTNMSIACYLYWRLANPRPDEQTKSFVGRAWNLFLYNPSVLLLGCLWIFAIIWAIVGGNWRSSAQCVQVPGDLGLNRAVDWNLWFLWGFLFGGFPVIIMSAMCESCRETDRSTSRSPLRDAPPGAIAEPVQANPNPYSQSHYVPPAANQNQYPQQNAYPGGASANLPAYQPQRTGYANATYA